MDFVFEIDAINQFSTVEVSSPKHLSYPITSNHNFRFSKIPLNIGTGTMPALGFGTLLPDLAETKRGTTNALRMGFRHLDCAERYRNEREVGDSLAAEFATHAIAREEVFITTKLWQIARNRCELTPFFICVSLGQDVKTADARGG